MIAKTSANPYSKVSLFLCLLTFRVPVLLLPQMAFLLQNPSLLNKQIQLLGFNCKCKLILSVPSKTPNVVPVTQKASQVPSKFQSSNSGKQAPVTKNATPANRPLSPQPSQPTKNSFVAQKQSAPQKSNTFPIKQNPAKEAPAKIIPAKASPPTKQAPAKVAIKSATPAKATEPVKKSPPPRPPPAQPPPPEPTPIKEKEPEVVSSTESLQSEQTQLSSSTEQPIIHEPIPALADSDSNTSSHNSEPEATPEVKEPTPEIQPISRTTSQLNFPNRPRRNPPTLNEGRTGEQATPPVSDPPPQPSPPQNRRLHNQVIVYWLLDSLLLREVPYSITQVLF